MMSNIVERPLQRPVTFTVRIAILRKWVLTPDSKKNPSGRDPLRLQELGQAFYNNFGISHEIFEKDNLPGRQPRDNMRRNSHQSCGEKQNFTEYHFVWSTLLLHRPVTIAIHDMACKVGMKSLRGTGEWPQQGDTPMP